LLLKLTEFHNMDMSIYTFNHKFLSSSILISAISFEEASQELKETVINAEDWEIEDENGDFQFEVEN